MIIPGGESLTQTTRYIQAVVASKTRHKENCRAQDLAEGLEGAQDPTRVGTGFSSHKLTFSPSTPPIPPPTAYSYIPEEFFFTHRSLFHLLVLQSCGPVCLTDALFYKNPYNKIRGDKKILNKWGTEVFGQMEHELEGGKL